MHHGSQSARTLYYLFYGFLGVKRCVYFNLHYIYNCDMPPMFIILKHSQNFERFHIPHTISITPLDYGQSCHILYCTQKPGLSDQTLCSVVVQ